MSAWNPVEFGLPSRGQLASWRIWDSYYLPRMTAKPGALLEDIAADLLAIEPFAIERLCAYLHIGLGTLGLRGAPSPAEDGAQNLALLDRWRDRLLGIIHLNANEATELSKVMSADISDAARALIFGGNLRRLLPARAPSP